MSIATECRRESYESVRGEAKTRRGQILIALKEHDGPMTASEIALSLQQKGVIGFYDRNYVSPRLRELYLLGLVTQEGKKKCPVTGKTVTLWALKE